MKERSPVKHFFIICGVVLAVCLFFLVTFRIEEPKIPEGKAKERAALFHMSPRGSGMSRQFQEQAARDELDDPTLMSFPNLKHGFSAALNNEGEPPQPKLPGYDVELIKAEMKKDDRKPLVGESPDPVAQSGNTLTKPEVAEIKVPKIKGRFSKRIIWIEDGREKESPFKAEEVLKLVNNKLPSGITELNIVNTTDGAVFFLVKKCGMPVLDQKVLDYYRKKSLSLFIEEDGAGPLPERVFVDWRLLL